MLTPWAWEQGSTKGGQATWTRGQACVSPPGLRGGARPRHCTSVLLRAATPGATQPGKERLRKGILPKNPSRLLTTLKSPERECTRRKTRGSGDTLTRRVFKRKMKSQAPRTAETERQTPPHVDQDAGQPSSRHASTRLEGAHAARPLCTPAWTSSQAERVDACALRPRRPTPGVRPTDTRTGTPVAAL